MTSRDFCYWLQGYFEILDPTNATAGTLPLGPTQVEAIRKHLALAFKHEIDPSMGNKVSQQALNQIHGMMGDSPMSYRC